MKIYTSKLAPVPVVERSIFSFVLGDVKEQDQTSVAFVDAASGRKLTRADLRRLSLELAWGLRNELPKYGGPTLRRGDTVLIFSPNSLAYPIVLLGGFATGLTVSLANSAYQPAEIAHQFMDSGAKVIFVHPALLPVVLKMFEQMKISLDEAKKRIVVTGWNEKDKGPSGFLQLEELFGKGSLHAVEKFNGKEADSTTLLCYSSGTTGRPKGVETTHKNLGTMMLMQQRAIDLVGDEKLIGLLPFYHIFGLTNVLLYPIYMGFPVVIMSGFEPVSFCKYIEQYGITLVHIVPPILVVLARHPAVTQYSLKTLRIIVSGAAPLGESLVKAVSARLESLGSNPITIQGYGLTETSPTTHAVPLEYGASKPGSVGVLLPNLEARLVDENGNDVPEGEPGEFWVRGPTVMKGYHNNPEATRECMTEDGFLKTGDIMIAEKDGFYSVVDRRKELIKYKGFQVPPAELEAVLLQHPDIADAAVIGVEAPEEAAEYPRAYVVPAKPLPSPSAKQSFEKNVQKWIEGRVAKHKYLRGGVKVIDAVPKSAAGKILRRELRERAKSEKVEYTPRAKAKL